MTFANEMRDFLGAYGAMQDIGNKQKALAIEQQRADTEKTNVEADTAYKKAMLALKGTGGGSGGGARADTPAGLRAEARLKMDQEKWAAEQLAAQSAGLVAAVGDDEDFNVDDVYAEPIGPAPVTAPEEELVPQQRKGGMVRKMAGGGAVEDDPAMSMAGDFSTGAAPTAAPAAAPAAPNTEATKLILHTAGEGVEAAMKSFTVDSKTPTSAVGDGSDKDGLSLNGTGGFTLKEYDQIVKGVDADGQLPPQMRTAAAYGAAWDFYTGKGDTKNAVKAVKGMLIANKRMTQTLGQLSIKALEGGNVEQTCQLLNDACNRFPSGHKIDLVPDDKRGLTYTVTDAEGKVVESGQMNTKQLQELAFGVADGSLFMSEAAKFAKAHAGDKPDGGVRDALGGVTSAYSARAALEDAYSMMDETTPYEERKAAYEKLKAADEALGAAKDAAGKAWSSQFTGKGNRAAYEAQGQSAINSAMTKKAVLPDAPVDPGATEAEAGGSGWMGKAALAGVAAIPAVGSAIIGNKVGGAIGDMINGAPEPAAPAAAPSAPADGLKQLTPDQVAQYRAAVASGKPAEALIAAIAKAGYSTEGL